jgi:catechol 2,3-dioxygenase-like lactoylglutathione lyase family enzyme
MATLFALTIDCASPSTLAPFWCEALGYRVLTVIDAYVILGPPDSADKPLVILQRVPEPKVAKNRVHVDLRADDPVAEAERLCRFGATRLTALQEQGGFRWLVMADPEGNEFCVGQVMT